MPKKLYEAIATLVGATIGAGILGIPYVVASSGFLTGLLNIIAIFIVILLTNLYLGEIVLRTKGKHQLTGYAEKYLGKNGKIIMTMAMVFGIYGALIAYTLGEGDAAAAIFGGNPALYSMIFFAIGSLILYMGIKVFEELELLISCFVIITVLAISFLGMGHISAGNLHNFSIAKIFLPYGVILFAFIGAPAIPEVAEELGKNRKELKKAVLIGTIIPLIVYLLFTLVAVGVVGNNFGNLNEDQRIASVALGIFLGEKALLFANLFAIFAMATSFLALSLALKEMFQYDYKVSKMRSWILTVSIPFFIFLIDAYIIDVANFISILGISGAITGGIWGIAIIMMHRKAQKKGERKPEYKIYNNALISLVIIIFFLLGIVYQLAATIG